MVVRYSPNGGNGQEKERLWNEFDRVVDRVKNGYRLCVLGDLNGWIEDMVRASITGSRIEP